MKRFASYSSVPARRAEASAAGGHWPGAVLPRVACCREYQRPTDLAELFFSDVLAAVQQSGRAVAFAPPDLQVPAGANALDPAALGSVSRWDLREGPVAVLPSAARSLGARPP